MTEGKDGHVQRQMTKSEREDLIRLVKQREKVAKTATEQRSAAMLAEFEQKIAALHEFDTNEVWSAATAAAIEADKKANEDIAQEADRLGIPKEFQPKLTFSWSRRGENEYRERRAELRRVAKAEIEALEKVTRVQIETQSVQAQTEIIANGLVSESATEFLNRLPAIETIMPALDVTAIQAKLADKARSSGAYRGPYLIDV
jgi:hypothetical protein